MNFGLNSGFVHSLEEASCFENREVRACSLPAMYEFGVLVALL